MELKINQITQDETIDLVLDTLKIGKQALVFVNTKRSAEKTAEDIAKFLKKSNVNKNEELAKEILNDLGKPTRQCERLAEIVKQGIAFHHAGLTSKQKELIQDNFRNGTVKIICCTPTLASGIDLPAFRTIIKDLKRFGVRGYIYIPVLEYLQMSGRAGRPKYDTEGQSIVVTTTENEQENIKHNYINGEAESIISKLAVEPVLRTYVLSLVASNFVNSREKLVSFFSKTFWAHQYEDMTKIEKIIDKMLHLLEDFDFIETKPNFGRAKMGSSRQSEIGKSDFVSASELNDELRATEIGKRVAQLYIDPLTAHEFITQIKKAEKTPSSFGLLHLISNTLEIRPKLNVKAKEYEEYTSLIVEKEEELLSKEPAEFEEDHDEFMNSIKTAAFFSDWIEEKDDEFLLDKFDVRPGESRAKIDLADWLLYANEELAKLIEKPSFAREVTKLRFRLKYGIKEELLPLVKLREIGRARARRLFNNGIKDTGDVKTADFAKLKFLIGEAAAKSIKEQVGEKVDIEIKPTKRKGQMSLNKFEKV
ncbi:MAG: helicase-related protein [Nanoarchaeota archaeon]